MSVLIDLKNDLDAARNKLSQIVDDGTWMKSMATLEILRQCLSLHNEIHGLFEKGISRVKAQNVTRLPRGRF